jgi:glycosyltransferase involved in cell wall biosynthesis
MDAESSVAVSGTPHHIAILLKSLRGGGAERVMLTLAAEFVRRGHRVELVLGRMRGPLLKALPEGVGVRELEVCPPSRFVPALMRLPLPAWKDAGRMLMLKVPKIVRTLPSLEGYLRERRPDILLSTLPKANIVAAWARRLAGTGTALVLREANQFSVALNPDNKFDRLLPRLARRWYREADGIIAVSQGVRDDLAAALEMPAAEIMPVLNPVDVSHIQTLCQQRPEEAETWPPAEPFVLAVGKLAPQKDFDTLIRAFARVRKVHPLRLVILGEGEEEHRLRSLAATLGIADHVQLPGHASNPYAYMRQASLLVLSSAWEGCPNVLLEALACGCPIVSTDCPSGPKEILANGKYGTLVPVRDEAALAAGMTAALGGDGIRYSPAEALADYSIERVTNRYLEVFERAMARQGSASECAP